VPTLQVSGQVVNFLTHHLGFPIPSPAILEKIGLRFRKAVTEFAAGNDIPMIRFAKGERKLEVMRPHQLGLPIASPPHFVISSATACGWVVTLGAPRSIRGLRVHLFGADVASSSAARVVGTSVPARVFPGASRRREPRPCGQEQSSAAVLDRSKTRISMSNTTDVHQNERSGMAQRVTEQPYDRVALSAGRSRRAHAKRASLTSLTDCRCVPGRNNPETSHEVREPCSPGWLVWMTSP
jgi:hypothetical protein